MATPEELLGTLVVVGITYRDEHGAETRHQVAGVVEGIDDTIRIRQSNGTLYTVPPAPEAFEAAVPDGIYTLHATGEQVVSPAFVATFTVRPPDPGADADWDALEEVVGRLWPGREIRIEPIAAGLTNQNFRVEVDGIPHFVRLPGPSTELLAVDRANELHNTRAAAAAGVGAKVLDHDPASGALVLEWIDGRTMSNQAFAAPGTPARIAETLRRLHAGPRFRDTFDMFRLTEHYLGVVNARSIRIPDGFPDRMPLVVRIEAALAARPQPTVPCHNDLLAENYLDDGARLWIIDYEYSGNNDPTFELGNTAQELGFDAARQEELCGAYFGPERFAREARALFARMRLQMIMSDVGWTLWAAIQAAISKIDYDFWGWAEERWGRATAAFDGPDFERLLQESAKG